MAQQSSTLSVAEKIKRYQYQGSTINAIYLMNLKRFLEETLNLEKNRRKKRRLSRLNSYFLNISTLIDSVERERGRQIISQPSPPVGITPTLSRLFDQLAQETDKFISLFQGTYQI